MGRALRWRKCIVGGDLEIDHIRTGTLEASSRDDLKEPACRSDIGMCAAGEVL